MTVASITDKYRFKKSESGVDWPVGSGNGCGSGNGSGNEGGNGSGNGSGKAKNDCVLQKKRTRLQSAADPARCSERCQLGPRAQPWVPAPAPRPASATA